MNLNKKLPNRRLPTKRRQAMAKPTAKLFNKRTLYRNRHVIQLAIVLACLAWGGYQITSGVLAGSENQNLVTGSTTVIQDGRSLRSDYPGLPPEVAGVIESVVATQRITGSGDGDARNGLAGSGVIINDTQILTAAHNVDDGAGLACSQTFVLTPGASSRASASKDAVTHASVEYGKNDDLAVLSVASGSNFKSLAHVTLAESLPQPGETVYVVNFQPAADGTVRTPFAKDPAYAEPAVFEVITLGPVEGRFALAAGGGQGFGLGEQDTIFRKGASGGAVVNGRGELIGLSIASESLAASRSAGSIMKEYGVDMPARDYQVAFMQQLDDGLVKRLQTGMVSCGNG